MTAPPVAAIPPVTGPNLDQTQLAVQIASLLRKNNGEPDKVIELLLADNTGYRERHRIDQETITTLKAKVPAEGALVLVGEEAKAYTAIKELKLTPEQIKTLQTEHTSLTEKVKLGDYTTLVKEAAEAVQYNHEPLQELLSNKGMALEMKDVTMPDEKDAKKLVTKKVPHVKKAGDDKAQPELLTTYAERDLKLFLPALRKVASGTGTTTTGRVGGAEFVSQTPSTTTAKVPGTGAEVAQRHIADRYAPPSALTAGAKKE